MKWVKLLKTSETNQNLCSWENRVRVSTSFKPNQYIKFQSLNVNTNDKWITEGLQRNSVTRKVGKHLYSVLKIFSSISITAVFQCNGRGAPPRHTPKLIDRNRKLEIERRPYFYNSKFHTINHARKAIKRYIPFLLQKVGNCFSRAILKLTKYSSFCLVL